MPAIARISLRVAVGESKLRRNCQASPWNASALQVSTAVTKVPDQPDYLECSSPAENWSQSWIFYAAMWFIWATLVARALVWLFYGKNESVTAVALYVAFLAVFLIGNVLLTRSILRQSRRNDRPQPRVVFDSIKQILVFEHYRILRRFFSFGDLVERLECPLDHVTSLRHMHTRVGPALWIYTSEGAVLVLGDVSHFEKLCELLERACRERQLPVIMPPPHSVDVIQALSIFLGATAAGAFGGIYLPSPRASIATVIALFVASGLAGGAGCYLLNVSAGWLFGWGFVNAAYASGVLIVLAIMLYWATGSLGIPIIAGAVALITGCVVFYLVHLPVSKSAQEDGRQTRP